MGAPQRITVGARGSLLAATQAQEVIELLKKISPCREFSLKKITTSGDSLQDRADHPQEKGWFVKEIEAALINKEIDLAVHSLKDMPVESPAGLKLAAVLKRLNPQDALVTTNKTALKELKSGSCIGTSSLRRRSQLLHWRKDLKIKELRGNLDTRIKKLESGEFDAIVVAASGMIRLGKENLISELLPYEIMLPAAGQGALAIQMRQGDFPLEDLALRLDDRESRILADAERSFLKAIGAGCHMPIAALARLENTRIILEGMVAAKDASRSLRMKQEAGVDEGILLGKRLAEELLSSGGRSLLKELR